MTVYRLDIAYDGSGFRGYASQEGQRTIQGELETALGTLVGPGVATSVAGRTDAGVHALGQVVSFEGDSGLDLRRLHRGLNGILGPEISVWAVVGAPDGFNARFSATWRRYVYRLDTRPAANPLTRGYVWHVGQPLDVAAMRASSEHFIGERDFTSFCRSVEGRSNVRDVMEVSVGERAGEVEVWVRANAFCHQMVRSIVGHLYDVGRGYASAAETPEVIAACDRGAVATVAPAHGLTLHEVGY